MLKETTTRYTFDESAVIDALRGAHHIPDTAHWEVTIQMETQLGDLFAERPSMPVLKSITFTV